MKKVLKFQSFYFIFLILPFIYVECFSPHGRRITEVPKHFMSFSGNNIPVVSLIPLTLISTTIVPSFSDVDIGNVLGINDKTLELTLASIIFAIFIKWMSDISMKEEQRVLKENSYKSTKEAVEASINEAFKVFKEDSDKSFRDLTLVVSDLRGVVSEGSVISSLKGKVGDDYFRPCLLDTVDAISEMILSQFETRKGPKPMFEVMNSFGKTDQPSVKSKIDRASKIIIDSIFHMDHREKVIGRLVVDFNVSENIARLLYSDATMISNNLNFPQNDKILNKSEKTLSIENAILEYSKKVNKNRAYFLTSQPGLGILLFSCIYCHGNVAPVHELEMDIYPKIRFLNSNEVYIELSEIKSSKNTIDKAIDQLTQRFNVFEGFIKEIYPNCHVVKDGNIYIPYVNRRVEPGEELKNIKTSDNISIKVQYI